VRQAVNDAIRRCTSESYRQYKDYGGRGVQVYLPWLEDRRQFAVYLMSLPGWDDPSLWLDRIDNDGHYEPGNLRWTTPSENLYNKRSRKQVEADDARSA
jgi:hypothetical protein